MVRQFYDGYGEHFKKADGTDFVYPKPKADCDKKEEICVKREEYTERKNPLKDIFSSIELDDAILIGVLIFLLYDGVDDYILILIIGIIFLMGMGEKESLFDK